MWADTRFGAVGGALMTGFGSGRCGGVGRGRGCTFELQEQAGLSGAVTFGRVPQSKIADLVQARGQDMLKEASEELVALQAAGAPAR